MDVIIMEPPSAPGRDAMSKIRRGHIGEEKRDKVEVTHFAAFCKSLLKEDGYVVLLAKFYMLDEFIVAFAESGFSVMSFLYAFMYAPKTVPKGFVSGIPRNVFQYAVLAKVLGAHPEGFVQKVSFRFY